MHAGTLYFTDSSENILRLPPDGGPPAPFLLRQAGIGALAAGDGALTFHSRSRNALLRAPLAGGPIVTLAAIDDAVDRIAVTGGTVVWITAPKNLHGPPASRVAAISSGGGTPTTLADGFDAPHPAQLVVRGRDALFASTDAILRVSLAGGPKVTVARDQLLVSSLTADGADVFWTARAGKDETGVFRAPIAGGPVTSLARFADGAVAIAVDSASVYVATVVLGSGGETGAVLQVPKSGGSPRLIADVSHPAALAASEESLFVLTSPGGDGGQLLHLPK
jgi:hypothetical protein